MLFVVIFLCLFSSSLCFDDYVLCRSCGKSILSPNSIIEKRSSSSVSTFEDTLFNKENVVVQVLPKDVFFQFPVVITSHSNCTGVGEWEEEQKLWFVDYRWKACVCTECEIFIGWIFEKKHTNSDQDLDIFYALIIPNLIDQKFLDSLIEYPKYN